MEYKDQNIGLKAVPLPGFRSFHDFVHFLQLTNGASSHAIGSAQLNIVILAGGFNAELVDEIICKNQTDTLVKDTTATMLRNTKVLLL